jgi:hypothetical protein
MQDRDALISEITRLIVSDGKVSARPWDAFVLVYWCGDGTRQTNGFSYAGDDHYMPCTPRTPLADLLEELRDASHVPGRSPWQACVLTLHDADRRASAEFVYGDATGLQVTPRTVAEIAESLRPR